MNGKGTKIGAAGGKAPASPIIRVASQSEQNTLHRTAKSKGGDVFWATPQSKSKGEDAFLGNPSIEKQRGDVFWTTPPSKSKGGILFGQPLHRKAKGVILFGQPLHVHEMRYFFIICYNISYMF